MHLKIADKIANSRFKLQKAESRKWFDKFSNEVNQNADVVNNTNFFFKILISALKVSAFQNCINYSAIHFSAFQPKPHSLNIPGCPYFELDLYFVINLFYRLVFSGIYLSTVFFYFYTNQVFFLESVASKVAPT